MNIQKNNVIYKNGGFMITVERFTNLKLIDTFKLSKRTNTKGIKFNVFKGTSIRINRNSNIRIIGNLHLGMT